MNVYLAIILYIVSVVAGILALFAGKSISKINFLFLFLIHLLFIAGSIFATTTGNKTAGYTSITSLSFLFTICSGLILFGISWNSNVYVILKFYFSLFSLTLLLFIFSPSRMINFLLTAKYADTMGKTFSLGENYFLEEQTSFMNGDAAIPHYKLVQKHGMFHETIERDIVFGGNLDSIKVLEFTEGKTVLVRGYSGKNTFVSSEIDSVDAAIKLVKEKKDHIERKL